MELFSIFSLTRKLDLPGWHDAYNLVADGGCPGPVYVGNLARWRAADIDAWATDGCPVGPELDGEDYDRLQAAVLSELQAADAARKGTIR